MSRLLIEYNLQFFAKDGPGGEKTEPATSKKLSDARKEGNVAKSKEIVTAASLLALFVLLKVYIGSIGFDMMGFFTSVYGKISTLSASRTDEINSITTIKILKDITLDGFNVLLPIFAVGFIIVFIGNLVQVKWKITTKPLKPKMSKINPTQGFKRIFSKQTLFNFLKSVALVIIIIFVVYSTIKSKKAYLFNLYEVSLLDALSIIGDLVINLGLKISAIYIVVGVGDFVFQKIKFKNDMKMTKQEVKDEYKNSEGDPQIKGQIRQKMRQASMRRMMQDLPKADVVITNPTHFAVALKYDLSQAKAPVVIAKGEDYLAQKIKEKARENSIEIVENRPLARALYANVEIGQEIPEELYQAVAEVLAYVYNLKHKSVQK